MDQDTKPAPITRTDAEWQQMLTPEQFKVLRKHATSLTGRPWLARM